MNLFYELLQVAIGTRETLSRAPSSQEWLSLYSISQKQSLIGIGFQGLNTIYSNHPELTADLPVSLKMKWLTLTIEIQKRNILICEKARTVSKAFGKDGFCSTILKGAGVSDYYPDPSLRQSGDIDLWVNATRTEIITYLKNKYNMGNIVIHHADVSIFQDVDTEIHFYPSYTYDPFRWRRYLSFFEQSIPECFNKNEAGYSCPSARFNAVYLILHIFRHIYNEGIGLRQLLDYYYLLFRLNSEDRQYAMSVLKGMRLSRFTAALMWVIQSVFGTSQSDNQFLLCEPDEIYGRFLLNEIEIGGNFGKWDKRIAKRRKVFGRISGNIVRLFSFISLSPSEVLWAPFWKLWHFCWRKLKGYN